jgi:hypothetical protein
MKKARCVQKIKNCGHDLFVRIRPSDLDRVDMHVDMIGQFPLIKILQGAYRTILHELHPTLRAIVRFRNSTGKYFFGIPFVEPPTGNNRVRAPQKKVLVFFMSPGLGLRDV